MLFFLFHKLNQEKRDNDNNILVSGNNSDYYFVGRRYITCQVIQTRHSQQVILKTSAKMLAHLKNRLREEQQQKQKQESQEDTKKIEEIVVSDDKTSDENVKTIALVVQRHHERKSDEEAAVLWKECHRIDSIASDLRIPYYCQQLVVRIYNRAGEVKAFKETRTENMRSILIATSFYTAYKLCRLPVSVDNLCVRCHVSFEQLKLGYNIFMENWTMIHVTTEQVTPVAKIASSLPSSQSSHSSGSSPESSSPLSLVQVVSPKEQDSLSSMSSSSLSPRLTPNMVDSTHKLSPKPITNSFKNYRLPAAQQYNNISQQNLNTTAQQRTPQPQQSSSLQELQKLQEHVKQQQYKELMSQQQGQLQHNQSMRAMVVDAKGSYHVVSGKPESLSGHPMMDSSSLARMRYKSIAASQTSHPVYPRLVHYSNAAQNVYQQHQYHGQIQHQSRSTSSDCKSCPQQAYQSSRMSVVVPSESSTQSSELVRHLTSPYSRSYSRREPIEQQVTHHRPNLTSNHIQVQALTQSHHRHVIATANGVNSHSSNNNILYNELNGQQQGDSYRPPLIPPPMARMLLK